MSVETTNPKISIVTPSFNQGKFLEKTILSVLEQGYPNLEYIVIDGGSTDESVAIIRKYADRLTYWTSEPDRGQSHAINKGFEKATGEIFGWLNSDDWYHPGALQAVAEAFAANPGAGAVVGAGEMVDEAGTQLIYKAPSRVDLDFLYHWLDDFFWQPSTFFKRSAWQTCGPVDEDIHYAMDLDLWLKIAKQCSFAVFQNNLSVSLKHPDAKTSSTGYRTVLDAIMVIASHGGQKSVLADVDTYAKYLEEKEHGLLWQIENRDDQLAWSAHLLEQERADVAEKDNIISSLLNSLSWKLTAPLRSIANSLKYK